MKQGDFLIKYRKRSGLNQNEISDNIGLSRASYTNIENNRQRVGIETLIRLSVILDFQILDFIEQVYDVKGIVNNTKELRIKILEAEREKINKEIDRITKTE